MRILRAAISVCVVVGAACAADTNPPAAVGILLRAHGATVWRIPSQSPHTAKAGEVLFAGDKLRSPEEAISFVYCPDKTLVTLAAGSEATVAASGMVLSAGRIADRKTVASCFLPQMVRVSVASRQDFGVGMVRLESDEAAARLKAMPEAQRNSFQAEWKAVQAALRLDPRNQSAIRLAEEILAKYRIPATSPDHAPDHAPDPAPALAPSPALQLWRQLVPMVSANSVHAARQEITKSREASGGLYRELLFNAVESRLVPSAPMSPLAGKVRALLAKSDGGNAALEKQFRKWERNRKDTFGGGSPMAELVSSYIEAFSSRQASASQYQAILEEAVPLGAELAAAGAWSNLAAIAIQEHRPDEALPLLNLAEMVWRSWDDAVGLTIADYWTGRIDVASGKAEAALRAYEQAASASAGVPEMSRFHQDTVTEVASVQRILGHGERVPAFEQWWPQFQAVVARHDAKSAAAGVKFPLNWENGRIREIRTEEDLVRRFDDYFTGEIRKIIAGKKPGRLENGRYIITWKAHGNEYSLYFRPGGPTGFVLDGLSEGPS